MGRHGRADAIHSIGVAAITSKASPRWAAIGLLGAVTAFLILSFYSVIGGWAIAYALETIYLGLPVPDASATRARFDTLLAIPL